MEWLREFVQQIPFRVLILTLVLLSGFLLFAPAAWTQQLQLDNFLKSYGDYVGFAFVVALVLILAVLVADIYELLKAKSKNYRENRSKKKGITSRLESLDSQEKAVLREFYLQELNTLWIPWPPDSVLAGLLQKELIAKVDICKDEPVRPVGTFVSLAPGVTDVISPSIVGMPTGELTQEQRQAIEQSRPYFVKEPRQEFPKAFG